ncbi:FAD-dependent oxidoreductase [Simiduia sp. 21SJ11W-1]|uniref:FAD-dependent oxidoreductase n=1 Tax=Simiduia sp. 21SJ11W-1 TaxID=2909669 RepID=UPI00209DD60B|nr:FAD-dependent oxidoreductase [Simiduia sp. 21SJ11W-1]UTA49019.1 FAD-dependent oxidoreductase [Simiduia sp. 21SJ11W-1]
MALRVAVAGAGLLGRLCAWRLALAGHRVQLFEAGSLSPSPAAATTAAGMISPLAELADSEPLIHALGTHSLGLWPGWLAALSQPVSFAQQGSLVVAHRQDQTLLAEFHRKLKHRLQQAAEHSRPIAVPENLNAEALHALEPALGHFNKGLLLPGEAHIDNQALMDQLLIELKYLQVPVLSGQAVEPEPYKLGDNRADWVLDCRGVGAKGALHGLRGQRGELLEIACPEVQITRPVRCLHPRYKLYLVPKPGQRYVLGATEIESEDRSPISLRSHWELSSALYALNPAFAEARILASRVNLRPAFMDHRPRLDIHPGLVRLNGLYRHGFLLAPAMVEALLFHLDIHPHALTPAQQEISHHADCHH